MNGIDAATKKLNVGNGSLEYPEGKLTVTKLDSSRGCD